MGWLGAWLVAAGGVTAECTMYAPSIAEIILVAAMMPYAVSWSIAFVQPVQPSLKNLQGQARYETG